MLGNKDTSEGGVFGLGRPVLCPWSVDHLFGRLVLGCWVGNGEGDDYDG